MKPLPVELQDELIGLGALWQMHRKGSMRTARASEAALAAEVLR
jgi:hypothetical protein